MNKTEINQTKKFMNALIADTCFDSFYLEEAEITTFNLFTIDGHIVREFYQGDDVTDLNTLDEFSLWSVIRPTFFSLIRGKRTPVSFKVVLHASKDLIHSLCEKESCTVSENMVKSLVLTIKYDGSGTSVISATALHTFLMDKSLDQIWDQWVSEFLNAKDYT